ncbi:MAG TPA: hypothetical protein PK014_02395 [Thermoanaerobaculia bacterium]|nr:hypothetical protein [Thermoanaerobaculia bacterium]HUM28917.1 hypothetical protein [Thermoanaerobaculia bacterium]HXK67150.1 hypothetical protein [Thermoanaerobaculia bacterium]
MSVQRGLLLTLFISAHLFAGHDNPVCKVTDSLRICIDGPNKILQGEEPVYRICFTNVSTQLDWWTTGIGNAYSLIKRYDSSVVLLTTEYPHPTNPSWYSHSLHVGPLEPDQTTCVDLKLLQTNNERETWDLWNHNLVITVNHSAKKLVPFFYNQPDLGIVQMINGPSRVEAERRVSFTYILENRTGYDLSVSTDNVPTWQIFLPNGILNPQIKASTLPPPEMETISSELFFWGSAFLRYTFSPVHLEPGAMHSVTIEFSIPKDWFFPDTYSALPLLTLFINRNSSPDDDIPFIHTFQTSSFIVLESLTP